MPSEMNIGMNLQSGQVLTNNSEVQGRNPLSSANASRDPFMVFSGQAIPYHNRMNTDPDIKTIIGENSKEHLNLSYETEQEKALRIGKVTINQDNTRPLAINNEANPTYGIHEDDAINIQLLYNPQAPTKPELWSGSFHPISLHGSIEHFASDAKNIKVSLNFVAKYIQDKQVNGNNVNDLDDFDSMGDAIWNFISSVYTSKWDVLFTDQKSNSLRAKITSKFIPHISSFNGNSKKDTPKLTPITINKSPSLPPLPAKSKKEINVISKYFHSKKPSNNNNIRPTNTPTGKSYAQVSKSPTNTSDVLKIKETFPALNTREIDQVNNIIYGQDKSKPHI